MEIVGNFQTRLEYKIYGIVLHFWWVMQVVLSPLKNKPSVQAAGADPSHTKSTAITFEPIMQL